MASIHDIYLKLMMLYYYGFSHFSLWKKDVWHRDLDALICCSGRECGCYGVTLREQIEYYRKTPPTEPTP